MTEKGKTLPDLNCRRKILPSYTREQEILKLVNLETTQELCYTIFCLHKYEKEDFCFKLSSNISVN